MLIRWRSRSGPKPTRRDFSRSCPTTLAGSAAGRDCRWVGRQVRLDHLHRECLAVDGSVAPVLEHGGGAVGPVQEHAGVVREKVEDQRAYMQLVLKRCSAREVLGPDD